MRTATAARMLERTTRRHEWTVRSETVALDFVDLFADALDAGEASLLYAWIDRTCQRYGGLTSISRLLSAAVGAVRDTVWQHRPVPETVCGFIDAVEARVAQIVAKPRLVRPLAANKKIEEIDVVLDEMITRLDRSDRLTAEHSRAVAAWCTRIAGKLGFSATDTTFVQRCGLIHDIGKLAVPHHILTAPRRLEPDEVEIMREHAAAGAEMVAAVAMLAPMTPMVRGHHERFDGNGYPDRLDGSRIPLATRVVSVADSFNAMIGTRPYRPPMPPTQALAELQRHRGTQFDPVIVDAMIDVVTTHR